MSDPIREAAVKFVNLRRAALNAKKKRKTGPDTYENNNAVYQRLNATAQNALYRLEVIVNREDEANAT